MIVGSSEELMGRELVAEGMNWISIPSLQAPIKVTAKTRYSRQEAAARVEPLGEDRVRVSFEEPQRALTPGQAVVFYQGDTVVGGGTIVAP